MDQADIVMCQMLFGGVAANNVFNCISATGSGHSIPTTNGVKTVADVSTHTLFDTNTKKVTVEATFSRALTTTDASDFVIIDG